MNKLICILLCILLISLFVVPVFADTVTEITPETGATMLAGATAYNCTLLSDLPSWLELPSDYDWNVVSVTDLFGDGSYYNIYASVIPDGYYLIDFVSGSFNMAYLRMSQVTSYRYDATYINGSLSGNIVSGNPYIYAFRQSASGLNYWYVFKNTEFNFNNANYKIVVPVNTPVNPSNPNYPTGNPYDPTVPSGWDNYSAMIAGLLYDNFKFTCNNTTYNAAWMPVGEYLMYDFLCKNNPQNDTVSFNNWEYQNYVYRICGLNHEDDVITIMELLDDISYYHGNYLASISNSLNYDPEYDLGFAYNVVTPLNKIASVYASDQEVEAREAAAENQQAIVDNFLDSEGEGYVSPSDISSVSSMSEGYKTHMSTDAQPSGIWDIFNSNNFGWFSQETVNQLDTTTSNQRGSNTFETPYLDEKIKDIYRSLGVNYDD